MEYIVTNICQGITNICQGIDVGYVNTTPRDLSAMFPSLTLVGTPRFRPFRNVWMLEELRDALPADVGFRYDHVVCAPHSDDARVHHPMGKIPSLLVRDGTEGDFTLIESAAINSWLGDRMREYWEVGGGSGGSGFLVPRPGSRDRAVYDSFVTFLVAEADSSGLWIHRKLESLGEKRAFGAVRYALLPARLQFDRAMAGVRAQLEAQRPQRPGYFLVGGCFTAADVLLVHCCDWAEGIDADKGPAASWFSKYIGDDVFQDYLKRVRARPAYLRAKQIQEDSPALA